MSKNIVLDIENVSKQYRLGEVGTGTLQHDLKRWWANVTGKEDPFLKIGETNDRTSKGSSDYVWALKDINFQIEEGQAVGIIGRNGAGKSTLLKLLSRVTKPTTGSIKYKGRIASLLEVGTGFHPEMTGRENIYLNGAILGMTRKEITRKFDEIVDFAGVERYIDTPVKRYSSGMYVRLAFAVAAHLESEILIVDEVLAVGDAEFQKKCLGKMGDVTKGEGRTILFVSHNMDSMMKLCNTGIFMENGLINYRGDIDTCVRKYFNYNQMVNSICYEDDIIKCNNFKLKSNNYITSKSEQNKQVFINGEDLIFELYFDLKESFKNLGFCFAIYDQYDNCVTAINTYHINDVFKSLHKGSFKLEFSIPKYILNTGEYSINMHINDEKGNLFKILERISSFIITDDGYRRGDFFIGNIPGPLGLVPEIKITNHYDS